MLSGLITQWHASGLIMQKYTVVCEFYGVISLGQGG